MKQPVRVEVLRGEHVESEHFVDALLLDERGTIVDVFGDPGRMVFPRSSIKMLQALPLVMTGAAKALSIPAQMLAIACASHRGERQHIEVVQRFFQQINLSETCLACGAHEPADELERRVLVQSGGIPTRLHNNCSGKHAGMLGTAQFLRESVAGYERYDHPVQVRLRQLLGELAGLDYSRLPWGIDGCGIPTYALPLEALAKSFLCYLPETRFRSEIRAAAQEITQAMIAHPMMVAGTRGLDSQLLQLLGAKALVKIGAEGVYAAVLPELGRILVLKAHDGASRASKAVLLFFLTRLGVLPMHQLDQLAQAGEMIVTSWAGTNVGSVRVVVGNELI